MEEEYQVKEKAEITFKAIEEDFTHDESWKTMDVSILSSSRTWDNKRGSVIRYFRRHRLFRCFGNGKFGEDFKGHKKCNNCPGYFDCSIIYNEIHKQDTEKEKRIDYPTYLCTDHWQFLRRFVLKRDGYKCKICNSSKSLNIHHRSYEHLWNEQKYPEDLIALCQTCHELFHRHRRLET